MDPCPQGHHRAPFGANGVGDCSHLEAVRGDDAAEAEALTEQVVYNLG